MRLGRLEDAAKLCDEAVNSNPSDSYAWSNLGIILLENESIDWAERCFENAVESSNYTNPVALNNLGAINYRRGSLINAERYYILALLADPRDENSAYSLGEVLLEKGDLNGANDAFTLCLNIDPNNVHAKHQQILVQQTLAYRNSSSSSDMVPTGSLPKEYLTQLFDYYATHGYDQHMLKTLDYSGPEAIYNAFLKVIQKRALDNRNSVVSKWRLLDLGCGTGLAALKFRQMNVSITSSAACDLSPEMVTRATALTYFLRDMNTSGQSTFVPHASPKAGSMSCGLVYDRVVVGDVLAFLHDETVTAVEAVAEEAEQSTLGNLIIACDVLGYLGDLKPLFVAVREALKSGKGRGLFLFTVEVMDISSDRYLESHTGETDDVNERGSVPTSLGNMVNAGAGQESRLNERAVSLGYRLEPSGRFTHSLSYISTLAEETGLVVEYVEEVPELRRQFDRAVAGCVFAISSGKS